MPQSERTLVLLVDDEPDMLDLSKAFLEGYGRYQVEVSSSAVEALCAEDIGRYDAIISDYQMPEMDGIEFLKRLRTKGINIPFILLTGRGREEIAMTALNSGADYYLTKGTDAKTQYAMLSDFIDKAVARYDAASALEHNLKRFRRLVESTSEIIEIVDADRMIRYVNPAVERYFGKKPEEIIGTRMMSSLSNQDQERLEKGLCSLLEGRTERARMFIRAKHPDGTVRRLELTITRFVDGRLRPELVINAREVPIESNGREPDLTV